MSSGYGLNGGASRVYVFFTLVTNFQCLLLGPSRCFPFWQEVLACYVVNTTTEDDSGKKICKPVLEDYYECLHHRKEVSRQFPHAAQQRRNGWSEMVANLCLSHPQAAKIRALQTAYRKREAETPRDAAPTAGEIRSLGLLERKDADVDVKHGSLLPTYSDNEPRISVKPSKG